MASSRRSVSWGAALKMAREKIKKKARREEVPSLPLAAPLLIFSLVIFCAAPQLTEPLEETMQSYAQL